MTGALQRINSMDTREFEKLAMRVARELGFQIRGTKSSEDRVEMDSYLSLPTGEVLHYFVVFSRKNPSMDEILDMIERINNPFVRILYMTTGEADEETRRLCSAKGIELAEWDRLMQLLEKYGILRELEREPEKEAFLPSMGEVEALENWARQFLSEGNASKAMEYVERALRIKPELPRLMKLKADIFYEMGRYADAETWYRKALSYDSGYVDAWLSLASALRKLGRDDEALIAMERASALRPDDYGLWIEKGLILYEKGMYDEALLSFTKATEINPSGKEAWNNRGLALKKMGRFEEAVDSFNRAIQLDGLFWDALLNKALLLHETGALPEAIRIYARMLEIKEDARIRCQKGFALEEMGRDEEAIEELRRAVDLDPTLRPCREELEKLTGRENQGLDEEDLVKEGVEEELEEKSHGIEEKSEPVGLAAIVSAIKQVEEPEEEIEEVEIKDIRDIREEIEQESGNIAEIFEAQTESYEQESGELEEVDEENVEDIRSLIEDEESEIYDQLVMQEEKIEEIGGEEKVEEVQPENMGESEEKEEEKEEHEKRDLMEGISSLSQLMTRGELYYKLKRYDEAVECFRALSEAKPNSKEIWNMYGAALFMAGDYSTALEAFARAKEIDQHYRVALLNIAESRRITGSPHEALEILNSVLKEEKGNKILWIKRGKVLSDMEREGASVQSYSKVVDIDKGMIRVWNALGISLLDIEEYEDAKDAFEKGISADERDYLLWNNYGALLYLMGDEDGAMDALERSTSENLRYAPANNNIGVILAKKGDIKGARERFGLALESDRNSIYAYNNTKYLRS